MALKLAPLGALSALAAVAMGNIEGMHLATGGLLQVHPSFVGDGVTLFPGHAFEHDPTDLQHLTPQTRKELYYAQEGHRPAFHGAKHGSMQANFNLATVVLDHSTHPLSVQCPGTGSGEITICFPPTVFDHVKSAWNLPEFNLVTFHVGCGDEYSGQRSYFHATNPHFNSTSSCVTVSAAPLQQEDALHSGEISWGTFLHPEQKKRIPVQGHVRLAPPPDPYLEQQRLPLSRRGDDNSPADDNTIPANSMDLNGNQELADPVDLTSNLDALKNFADESDFDMEDLEDTYSDFYDELGFTDEDGDIENNPDVISDPNAQDGSNTPTARRMVQRTGRGVANERSQSLGKRWWWFCRAAKAVVAVVKKVVKVVVTVVEVIVKVAKIIVNIAIISVKLLLVPFGVPFDHSYHEDFKFRHYLESESSPQIFDYKNGYEIWGEKGQYSFQCAKCGVNADFNVDGRLAFSIKDGITAGRVAFVNKDSFNIDAIFGLKLEDGFDKPIKSYEKQIAAFPLSPLAIPGILTLGPEITISGTMDLSIQGKAQIALGGSLAISPGTASLSLVKQEDNVLEGLDVQFTPVAKFDGKIQATLELGLPIALECGLDILNGKFKQTVGLINKPSVYGIAKFSNEATAACKNGVELRLGAQNKVYANAFKKWDVDIKTFQLYEAGIGCVSLNGFDANAVDNTTGIINDVVQKLRTDPTKKPTINDVAATLKAPPRDFGFRIIMNEAKEAILVSGKDGYIYLAANDEKYDASAPVGSVNLTSNLFNMDVYARIMSYKADGLKGYAAQVRFWNVSKIPGDEKAAFLNVLDNTDKNDAIYYGLMLKERKVDVYFPTFCKTPAGTRLFATEFAIDKDGNIVDNNGKRGYQPDLIKGLETLGVNDPHRNCGTVRLTSQLSGK